MLRNPAQLLTTLWETLFGENKSRNLISSAYSPALEGKAFPSGLLRGLPLPADLIPPSSYHCQEADPPRKLSKASVRGPLYYRPTPYGIRTRPISAGP